jgi:hypothetical protein
MSIPGLPFEHSIAGAQGDAYGEAIALPGIKSGDDLLAVIAHAKDVGTISGLDVSGWTVGAGTITSDSDDTDGLELTVIWTRAP